jgi:hypothetical protein
MTMEQSVPKRRHTKFRRRGITQKKTYNMTKVTVAFRNFTKGAYKYFRARQDTEENRIRPMHFECQITKA